jgi:hypothetical protein
MTACYKPVKIMEELIEKLKQIDELYLPNGATGAVWLEDVIEVIEKHYSRIYDEDE